jgi:carbon monoxide dehydrogenase subunit G
MQISGNIIISATRQQVWLALNDPAQTHFPTMLSISNCITETSCTLHGDGIGEINVQLADENDGQATRLSYQADAKSQAAPFFSNFAQALTPTRVGIPAWAWIALLIAMGTGLLVVQLS